MEHNMEGQVVVITGGGGVLCSTIAKEYAARGAKVAVTDLKQEAAQLVADEIVKAGGIAKAYAINCLDKQSIIAAHDAINKDLGACTILVNGAGGNHQGNIRCRRPEHLIDEHIEIHVLYDPGNLAG